MLGCPMQISVGSIGVVNGGTHKPHGMFMVPASHANTSQVYAVLCFFFLGFVLRGIPFIV